MQHKVKRENISTVFIKRKYMGSKFSKRDGGEIWKTSTKNKIMPQIPGKEEYRISPRCDSWKGELKRGIGGGDGEDENIFYSTTDLYPRFIYEDEDDSVQPNGCFKVLFPWIYRRRWMKKSKEFSVADNIASNNVHHFDSSIVNDNVVLVDEFKPPIDVTVPAVQPFVDNISELMETRDKTEQIKSVQTHNLGDQGHLCSQQVKLKCRTTVTNTHNNPRSWEISMTSKLCGKLYSMRQEENSWDCRGYPKPRNLTLWSRHLNDPSNLEAFGTKTRCGEVFDEELPEIESSTLGEIMSRDSGTPCGSYSYKIMTTGNSITLYSRSYF